MNRLHRRMILAMVLIAAFAMATSGVYISVESSSNHSNNSLKPYVSNTSSSPPKGNLTVVTDAYPTFLDSFSPFNPSVYPSAVDDNFYEPLYQIDVYNGTSLPWLATGYNWSNHYLTLTFNLRQGVHYSNNALFNSSDVNYTFQLEKKYPSLDSNGVWSYLTNVTTKGLYEIVFNFSSSGIVEFYYIATTLIIYAPQFQNASNPTTFTDPNPIGTGPYMLSSFSSKKLVLTANPHYWQPDEPHIKNVIYNAYTSNTAADEALEAGDIDWSSLFAPNMTTIYTSKDPEYYHYYFQVGAPATLWTNNLRWPLNQSFFRQAISMSINRTQVYLDGEYGYEPPATLNIQKGQISEWVNNTLRNEATNLSTFNTSKALNLLESHGYYLSGGSLYAPNGTKVPSMTIQTVSGFTDYDADISFIASDLKGIGLSVTAETPVFSTDISNLYTGNYWMSEMYSFAGGPNPYYIYDGDYYDQGNVTPIGQSTSNDFERWNSSIDGWNTYLKNFTLTANKTLEYNDINNMTSILLNQMPSIPLVYAAYWYEYDNKTIGGFPTPKNDYWMGSIGDAGDVVILHLYEKSAPPTPVTTSLTDVYIIVGVIVAAVVIGVGSYIGVNRKKAGGKVPKQPKKPND